MARVLVAAGIYNVVWGAVAILAPVWCFRIVGMETPNYPELWQCIGMIVGVYGIGYIAAATDPLRHWPIVLVGLLGKILGPIGFAGALLSGRFPVAFGWNILTNDLVWWIPFGMILWTAWRAANQMPTAGRTAGIGG
ncbi:MAG: alkyl hydroperoxide reductase [Planctomycetia bacterium]|nr:alkyl hydroperoxide reductase [Planctomycetia bacterium]